MKRVLVVDDNRENVELLSGFLTQDGHTIQIAGDPDGALHRLRAWKPHLVLLDVDPQKSRTVDIVSKMRSLVQDEYTAIVLISALMSPEEVIKGFELGADDYLTRPYRTQDLISRIRSMLRFWEPPTRSNFCS